MAALLVPAALVMCMMAYQDYRTRSIKRYLLVSMVGLAAVSVAASERPLDALGFGALVSGMISIFLLAGAARMADWVIGSAAFLFLIPYGIHVPLIGTLLGVASAHGALAISCLYYNTMEPDVFDGISGWGITKKMARFTCRRRREGDKVVLRATKRTKNGVAFDIWRRSRTRHIADGNHDIIMPTAPYITHMAGASFFMLAVSEAFG